MSQLQKRLKIVWGNNPPKRYLPRSLTGRAGWGVFDVKRYRFVSDAEVKQISLKNLQTETITN